MPLMPVAGMELLGRTQLTAAATSTAIVNIPPRDWIVIMACVTGYSGGGIFSLRFGTAEGAVDTTARYWHYNQPTAVANAATAWAASVATASATMVPLAHNAVTSGRTSMVWMMNQSRVSHPLGWNTANESGAVATIATGVHGHGEWVSAAAGQARAVQMVASANNMNAGSGFAVFGANLT
jgi:hypothetical protein